MILKCFHSFIEAEEVVQNFVTCCLTMYLFVVNVLNKKIKTVDSVT